MPEDFEVPERLEHERFTLRMLSVADVAKDFAAINQRVVPPDGASDPWSDTSFLKNLADLGWHETEFRIRRSFAYTMVRPDESEVIGCVYVYPPKAESHDALVRYWVTRDAWDEGLHPVLADALRDWLARAWPFEQPLYEDR